MNYMTSEEVNKYLATLTPEQRVDFLRKVKRGYCEHCGWPEPEGTYCQCTNDE